MYGIMATPTKGFVSIRIRKSSISFNSACYVGAPSEIHCLRANSFAVTAPLSEGSPAGRRCGSARATTSAAVDWRSVASFPTVFKGDTWMANGWLSASQVRQQKEAVLSVMPLNTQEVRQPDITIDLMRGTIS